MKNWDFANHEYVNQKVTWTKNSLLGMQQTFLIKDLLDKDNIGDYFLIFLPATPNWFHLQPKASDQQTALK